MNSINIEQLKEEIRALRKEQLKNGEISEDEYFEWKINWPATSSDVDEKGHDKGNNTFQWRK